MDGAHMHAVLLSLCISVLLSPEILRWIYKMYGPGVPEAATTWEARSTLLERYLLGSKPDIIALQETCAESFADDFSFLIEAGYDVVLHNKGRMRPATFWKRSRFCLCEASGVPVEPFALPDTAAAGQAECNDVPIDDGGIITRNRDRLNELGAARCVIHGDRTLTVPLRALDHVGRPCPSLPALFVVNCHCE